MRITRVLTDNGREITDRLFGLRRRPATGAREFDRLRAALPIAHRLAPPTRPETNGMKERFNGRIEDVLQSHPFRSGENLDQTILRHVRLCNGQLPQSVLKEARRSTRSRTGTETSPSSLGNNPMITRMRHLDAQVDALRSVGAEIADMQE